MRHYCLVIIDLQLIIGLQMILLRQLLPTMNQFSLIAGLLKLLQLINLVLFKQLITFILLISLQQAILPS